MNEEALDLTVEGAEGHALDGAALRALALAVLAAEGVEGPCALGIAFVGEGAMQALNAEHRQLDEVTDVLAFPMDGVDELPAGLERQLGDVVVCFEQAERQAREAGVSTTAEVRTLVVHGLLHLLGHDHGDEMRAKEESYR